MAVGRQVPKKTRGPSFRGRLMIDTIRGTLRIRAWPRKRGKPKSTDQAWWVDWFVQANRLAKYADPMSQVRAIEMTKGSGMYPRDVILKAIRGRLYFWASSDGWKWYSVAAQQDVSESLDALGQTVGDILVRALDRWRPPPAGNAGDVLTNAGPDAPPDWQPAAGGGGFAGGALVKRTTNQSIPSAVLTVVNWNAETYDTAGLHDNAVNNSRITVPTGVTWVRLAIAVIWDTNGTGYRLVRLKKNGSVVFDGNPALRIPGVTNNNMALVSSVLAVIATDYFEVEVFQTTAGALNILTNSQTSFSMQLL